MLLKFITKIVTVLFVLNIQFLTAQQNFWQRLYGPFYNNVYPTVNSMDINGSNFLFAATDGKIHRSSDWGDTWDLIDNGIPTGTYQFNEVYCMNGYIFVGESQLSYGIFRSSNNGDLWELKNNGIISKKIFAIESNSNDYLFAGGIFSTGMYRSSDYGDTWTQINNGLIDKDVTSISINKSNNYLFVGTIGGGVFRSTNDGNNWQKITGDTIYNCNSVYVNNLNGDVYVGFDDTGSHGIMRSTNNGNSWQVILGNLPWNPRVLENTIITNKKNYIFFRGSNSNLTQTRLFRSTDFGASWTDVSEGINPPIAFSTEINNEQFLFCGSYSEGVFRSVWPSVPVIDLSPNIIDFDTVGIGVASYDSIKVMNLGTPELQIINVTSSNPHFVIDPLSFQVETGTEFWVNITFSPSDTGYYQSIIVFNSTSLSEYDTVFVSAYATILTDIIENTFTNSYQLSDCYPNPFNPSTKIKYSIPQSSNVIIKVFDILGNEIATLVNEEKDQGVYTINFDANNLASGLYLYRIQAGSFIDTKKMILLK